jgi:hypothetical protein
MYNLEPWHPPDVHFAEVVEGDCFSDQPPGLAFHGERQGRAGFNTHHNSLEPCVDVGDGPLEDWIVNNKRYIRMLLM